MFDGTLLPSFPGVVTLQLEREPLPSTNLVSRKPFPFWPAVPSNPSLLLMLVREIRSQLSSCRTVLDIGCGNFSPMSYLSGLHLVGVDGYPPAVEEAKSRGTHDEMVLGNVSQVGELFRERRFDACVALDVIEHLKK